MGNASLGKSEVEIVVDCEEEVFGATIENDVEFAGFKSMDEVDDGVFVPTFWVVFQSPKSVGHVPVFGKWANVDTATRRTAVGKEVFVSKSEP